LVLAEYYLRKKEKATVESILKEVQQIAPNEPRVLALQGKLLMAQQRYNEALVPLIKLVTKESKAIIGRVLLGETYMRLGQNQDARRQFELALKINEFDIKALLLLANIEQAERHFDKAISFSRKVQKIKPDLYLGYASEGETQLAAGKFKAASDAFKKANQIEPSSVLAIKRASVLIKTDRLEQAKQPLLQWLKTHPDDVSVRLYLGSVYQSLGENADAIQTFIKVIRAEPENAAALNNLAWLYALDNNPEALVMAERVYRLLPDNAGIKDTYGWVLVLSGQPEKGRQILEQAIKALPDVAEIQYHYAVALAKSGEKVTARERLTRLLQGSPTFTGVDDARSLLESLQTKR
jgi:putative PEP-CTERM system TPR-repeat lipoprotein